MAQVVKESTCWWRRRGSNPWSGKTHPRRRKWGNGNPFQYSCLESSRDRGAWWAALRGVTHSWTWISMCMHACNHIIVIMIVTYIKFSIAQHWLQKRFQIGSTHSSFDLMLLTSNFSKVLNSLPPINPRHLYDFAHCTSWIVICDCRQDNSAQSLPALWKSFLNCSGCVRCPFSWAF